jgi:pyruvate formate lyase activating enzyme
MTKSTLNIPKGQIFKIQKYCLHDGPGIRTTVFFQGCPLKCRWCHNPESQSCTDKIINHSEIYSADSIIHETEKDLIFFDQSGGGVTFSGGEPLSQPDFLFYLLDQCRKRQIHTCIDTSGHSPLDVFKGVCQKTDMILFDLKLIDNKLHKKYTGVTLKPVLDNLEFLSKENVDVIIRIPLIPGITDNKNNIDGIISLLIKLEKFKDVSLLPFHNTGEGKYETLGIKNHLKGVKPCSKIRTDQIKQKFAKNGFNITISE